MNKVKVAYIGGLRECPLRFGEVYKVEKIVAKAYGGTAFVLEGVDGEYDKSLFEKLENKGFHYLISETVPKVGNYMRLTKVKSNMSEFMTGEVRLVEKSAVPGVYIACTEKGIYEVSPIK